MKKVGKTTRPFRYDLNQIPYDYAVEVTNRFKRLDLTDIVPEELWTKVCNVVQETVIRTNPKKKAKWLSGEPLQIAEKRREAKGKGEKERYIPLNSEFQTKTRPLHMLSTRDPHQNKGHIQTESEELDKDIPCK